VLAEISPDDDLARSLRTLIPPVLADDDDFIATGPDTSPWPLEIATAPPADPSPANATTLPLPTPDPVDITTSLFVDRDKLPTSDANSDFKDTCDEPDFESTLAKSMLPDALPSPL
jgi:hypothetical protein